MDRRIVGDVRVDKKERKEQDEWRTTSRKEIKHRGAVAVSLGHVSPCRGGGRANVILQGEESIFPDEKH
jgi:hypothetical protein